MHSYVYKNKKGSLLTSRSTALIAFISIELFFFFGIGYIKKAVFKISRISTDFDFPRGNEGKEEKWAETLETAQSTTPLDMVLMVEAQEEEDKYFKTKGT